VKPTTLDEITAYVDAVRESLADLPADVRDELIEDLPEHLAEVLADGDGTLVDRLGTPEAYAADLRASAGLVGGFPDPPPSRDRLRDLIQALARRAGRVDVAAGPLLGYARASEFLTLLRPGWWVLRGYLAAMLAAAVLDDSGQPMGLLPRVGGSEAVAVVLLGVAVLASVWLGRRTPGLPRGPRTAVHAAAAVLVLVAIGGFLDADQSARGSSYDDAGYSDPYGNVRDVFVYDSQGHLVTDARLLDQDGQPIRLGDPWCATDEWGNAVDGGDGQHATYPYCPQNAPFQLPSATVGSPSVQPSPSRTIGR
jgi:hypothetical protein